MYTLELRLCQREGDERMTITKTFPAFNGVSGMFQSLSLLLDNSDWFIVSFQVTPDPVSRS